MQQPVRHRPSAVGNEPKRNARRPCMITQRLGAEEGDTPVEQQPAAMQDFDPTYDRCGSFFAIRSHADIHFTVRIGLKAGIFQSGHHRPVIWPTRLAVQQRQNGSHSEREPRQNEYDSAGRRRHGK